jgi:hypothetical protein
MVHRTFWRINMRILNLDEMLSVSGGSGCRKAVKKSRCGGKSSGKSSGKGSCKSSGKDSGKGSGCVTPPVDPAPTPTEP